MLLLWWQWYHHGCSEMMGKRSEHSCKFLARFLARRDRSWDGRRRMWRIRCSVKFRRRGRRAREFSVEAVKILDCFEFNFEQTKSWDHLHCTIWNVWMSGSEWVDFDVIEQHMHIQSGNMQERTGYKTEWNLKKHVVRLIYKILCFSCWVSSHHKKRENM